MNANPVNNPSHDLARIRASKQGMLAWQQAQQSLRANHFSQALTAYNNLVRQFPGVAQLWAELGSAAAGALDFELANQATRRAEELAFADASLLVALSMQYYRLRRLDQASACFQRALAVDPASVNTRYALAEWLERSRRLEEAWECIQAGLKQHPGDGRLRYFEAFLLHRKGLQTEAETVLRDLTKADQQLPPATQADIRHLLGLVLDALGQYDEAYKSLAASKSLRRLTANTAALEKIDQKMSQARRQVLAELTPAAIGRWREESEQTPCPHPLALLGGAMRSGTTLLEQILAAHPEVCGFDESHAFMREVADVLNPPFGDKAMTGRALNGVPTALRAQLTGRYFKSLLREGAPRAGAKILLDKNPFITGSLHLWLRFFPRSKIIIALRDPRDVVISCYFQNFPLAWSNVRFLSLAGAAQYYADCMDAWLRLRELGGFDWIETRYEDLVHNLAEEGRRVTGFLGLPWDDAQGAYYEKARGKFVHAPTYNEVTKPVYDRAVGRWKHYAAAMEPIKPVLEKHCTAFGYG